MPQHFPPPSRTPFFCLSPFHVSFNHQHQGHKSDMHTAVTRVNSKLSHYGNVVRPPRTVSTTLSQCVRTRRTFTIHRYGKDAGEKKHIAKGAEAENSRNQDLQQQYNPGQEAEGQSQDKGRRKPRINLRNTDSRVHHIKRPVFRKHQSTSSLPQRSHISLIPGISSAYPVQSNEIIRNRFLQSTKVTKDEVIDGALRIARSSLDGKTNAMYAEDDTGPSITTTPNITRYQMSSPHDVAESWSTYFEGQKRLEGENAIDEFAKYLSPEFVPDQDLFLRTDETGMKLSKDESEVDSNITAGPLTEYQGIGSKPGIYDMLNAVGLDLEKSTTQQTRKKLLDKDSSSTDDLGASYQDENAEAADEDYKIQWDSLPLSPLLHQRLTDARNQFRLAKPPPQSAPAYDTVQAKQLSNDYMAQMLATHVRVCRFTNSRLPSAFLLSTHAVMHPTTNELWELPSLPEEVQSKSDIYSGLESKIRQEFLRESLMNPPPTREGQDVVFGAQRLEKSRTHDDENGSDTKYETLQEEGSRVPACHDSAQLIAEHSVSSSAPSTNELKATTNSAMDNDSNNTEHNPAATTISTISYPGPKPLKAPQRRMKSYTLYTRGITDAVANLSPKTFAKSMPPKWRQKIDFSGKIKLHWRADTSDIVLRHMQAHIISRLKPLRSYARRGFVRVSMSIDGHLMHEATHLPSSPFNSGILLYLGPHTTSTNNTHHQTSSSSSPPSFFQSIKTLATQHSLNISTNLFTVPNAHPASQNTYPHTITLQAKRNPQDQASSSSGGSTILSYDLTRLLTPTQISDLRTAGFEHLMYHIADWDQSRRLLQKLFELAHYVQ